MVPVDEQEGGPGAAHHLRVWLSVLESAHASRGLRVLPNQSRGKSDQFRALTKEIILCGDHSRVLFVGLSNDWVELLVNGGEPLRLENNAGRRWANLSPDERSDYKAKKLALVHRQGGRHLSRKLRSYMDQLQVLFGRSGAEIVYHSSVLERLHRKIPHFDLLFAVLNSFLQDFLKKSNITNKFGRKITFKFINVASQFQAPPAGAKSLLFKPHERRNMVVTHRTEEAYKELYIKMNKYIMRDLNIT